MDNPNRFANRAGDYDATRPSYSEAVLDWLDEQGLVGILDVADVGSGTGIFSSLLLARGHRVFAVEPSAPMRAVAEENLGHQPRFHSVAGRAEDTTLADESVDLVTAAQAFHWFDVGATKAELRRILCPHGLVALVFNERDVMGSRFMADFESLLQAFGTDYEDTTRIWRELPARMAAFFAGAPRQARFDNTQLLDEEGLVGRFFSISCVVARGAPGSLEAERAVRELFAGSARDHRVELRYITRVFLGEV